MSLVVINDYSLWVISITRHDKLIDLAHLIRRQCMIIIISHVPISLYST